MPDGATRQAELHRMETAEHICPYGLKTLDLLKREGFECPASNDLEQVA
jgi:hypothetical protein